MGKNNLPKIASIVAITIPLYLSIQGCKTFVYNGAISQNGSFYAAGGNLVNFNKKDNGLVKIIFEKETKNIRKTIKEKAEEKYGCFLFGDYLDELEEKAKQEIKNNDYNFEFRVPMNFLVEEMDFSFEIIKNKFELNLYHDFNSKKTLLMNRKVGLGRNEKGRFSTPKGNYFLNRVINSPWWYPPSWADRKKPFPPGKNNPYGLWMSELSRANYPGSYNWGIKRDSKIRIHSTNNPKSVGKAVSHGCIRMHPFVAEELFPAILHYSKHKLPKKNSRGTIYPLKNAIPLTIK
ncbi:MAG: L,D-transpeptidase family protein [Candidatus Pacearchaeota archaeon]|jgi:hypothetical protein